MSDIIDEVKEAIEKSLPAQTAGVMRKFIQDAEANKRAIDMYKQDINLKEERIKNLEAKLKDYEQMKMANDEIESQYRSLEARERNIELERMQLKLKAAESEKELCINLVNKVFGHPSVSIDRTASIPVAVHGGDNYSGTVYVDQHESESTTTTQTKK